MDKVVEQRANRWGNNKDRTALQLLIHTIHIYIYVFTKKNYIHIIIMVLHVQKEIEIVVD